jgi:hypothetical protein
MTASFDDKAFVVELKKKIEKELAERELNELTFWKEELGKLSQKKSESLGSLQLELKNLIQRMENRIKMLKKGSGM